MAAKIGSVRTAPREVRGERLSYVVQLEPAGVLVKEKGRRGWLGPVSYDALYSLAAKLEAGVGPLARQRRKERA